MTPPVFPENFLSGYYLRLLHGYCSPSYEYGAEMSKFSSPVKFDVEKFDGKINFGLWQVQVKDVLIQSELHKALKGRPSPDSGKDFGKSSMSDED